MSRMARIFSEVSLPQIAFNQQFGKLLLTLLSSASFLLCLFMLGYQYFAKSWVRKTQDLDVPKGPDQKPGKLEIAYWMRSLISDI